MQAYLGTIVCKFGGDPVICLREEAMYMYIVYIMYIVTNRLQYFAQASGRSNNQVYVLNNAEMGFTYQLKCVKIRQPILQTGGQSSISHRLWWSSLQHSHTTV